MAGNIQIINPRRTGFQEFTEAAQPYLQMAMQAYLRRQMEEQQKQKAYEEAERMGLITKQPYQQVPTQQGMQNISPMAGIKIPTQYKYALQQQPGMQTSMKFGEGGVPQFGMETQQPTLIEQMMALQVGSGQGRGFQGLPPQSEEEIKQQIISEDGNPEDYDISPIYSTGKGGLRIITGWNKKLSQAGQQRLKTKQKSKTDFEIARNKLRVTAAAYKAMQQKAGGEGFLPAASAAFGGTKLGRAMGINPYTKAYSGQLVEAAASLAKLASPSARVGQEIIEQFKRTLPDVWSIANPGEFQNQIRFSLHNAFATALANAGETYTPETRNEIDKMVDDLVNVPALDLQDLNKLNQGLSIDENKYAPIKQQSQEDLSQMSDEELRRIAAGG